MKARFYVWRNWIPNSPAFLGNMIRCGDYETRLRKALEKAPEGMLVWKVTATFSQETPRGLGPTDLGPRGLEIGVVYVRGRLTKKAVLGAVRSHRCETYCHGRRLKNVSSFPRCDIWYVSFNFKSVRS